MIFFIKKNLFLILFVGLACGCSKKNIAIPHDVIPMKQMIEVMTDVHLAEAAKDAPTADNKSKHTIEEYYAFIFDKYHITKDQFQHSFNFYKSNPELMEEIYAEVLTRLSELQAKPGNH